jgi:hypothetical protein
MRGAAVGLGYCVTSRTVAGSIPDGVNDVFYWHNPSSCTTALGSTRPPKGISASSISRRVNAAGALG